ncbi:MAG: TonB-dependent receptor, partial [Thermoguttaceae bacterium]|nr:TonB-dependent receptor [Thermoguttaceae bacterium]
PRDGRERLVARFGNSYIDGLSTLSPEQDLQFDLGLSCRRERVSWGLRGFYAAIQDYILPVPAAIDPCPPDFIPAPHELGRDFYAFPPQWRADLGTLNENADTCLAGYQYVNLDWASLAGADFVAEARLLDRLAVFGNMSYVRGTNHAPVAFVANEAWYSPDGHVVRLGGSEGLPGIYPLNGVVGVRLLSATDDRWLLEWSTRMVARRSHVAYSLSEIPSPGFATHAIRGYYRLHKNVRLSAYLENLLDREYAEPGSLAFIDRNGRIGFIKEPGFTALVGIEGRF